jgi:hypothetical protein
MSTRPYTSVYYIAVYTVQWWQIDDKAYTLNIPDGQQ